VQKSAEVRGAIASEMAHQTEGGELLILTEAALVQRREVAVEEQVQKWAAAAVELAQT